MDEIMLRREHPLRRLAGVAVRGLRYLTNRIRVARLRRRGADLPGLVFIAPDAQITRPQNVSIGPKSFIGKCHLYALDRIEVGKCTIIGNDAFICTGSHNIYSPDFALTLGRIQIGDYVWVATGAVILPGVRIGDGAVIGAGAVVSRDVPANAVVVGNPGRVVKTDRPLPIGFDPLSLATINVSEAVREFKQTCLSSLGLA